MRQPRRVRLATYIRPICLPPPEWELTRSEAIVAGWGNTSTGFSSVAKEARLIIWGDDTMCSMQYNNPSYDEGLITDHNLCASDPNKKADACKGDSGGPLICEGCNFKVV